MDELDLLDWKRRVSELYAEVRAAPDPEVGWHRWCETRRQLFREHPQSPVPADVRSSFGGPFVYDYDPDWRLLAEVKRTDEERLDLPSSDGGVMTLDTLKGSDLGAEEGRLVHDLSGGARMER